MLGGGGFGVALFCNSGEEENEECCFFIRGDLRELIPP
jgi:hypothetical protein